MKTICLIFALALSAHAACTGSSPTWTSTADQTSVNTCVTNASSGDLINVSNGSASWNGLTVSKGVRIVGGNGGTTTITCPTAANAVTLNTNSTAAVRLSGFTMTCNPTGSDSADPVIVNTNAGNKVGRLDHMTFNMTNNGIMIGVTGLGGFLLDHNTLTGGGAAEIVHNLGTNDVTGTGGWTDDVTPGSPFMIYYEDNTVTCSDPSILCKIQESFYGAREVVRHNTLHFASFDAHGSSGTPSHVSTRWYEIYNNSFNDDGKNQCCAISVRGGSGLAYNNTDTNTGGSTMSIQIEEDATCGGTADSNAYHVGSGILSGPTGANFSTIFQLWNNWTNSIATDSCLSQGQSVSHLTQPTLAKCESAADVTAGCSNSGAAPTYTYMAFTYPYPLDANGLPNPAGSSPASTPTFSPVAGTYTGARSVTISTTSGSVICYNTAGSPATNGTTGCATGTLYVGPVTVSVSQTLFAVAGGTGFTDSTVGAAAYVINPSLKMSGVTTMSGSTVMQ